MGHKKAFRVHQASSPPPLLDISQICYWLFIFFTHQEDFSFYEILLCSADGKLHSSVSNNNKLSIQHRNAFNSNGFDCVVVLLFRRQYTTTQTPSEHHCIPWFLRLALHRQTVFSQGAFFIAPAPLLGFSLCSMLYIFPREKIEAVYGSSACLVYMGY